MSLPIAQSVHSTDRENAALEKRGTVWNGCVAYPCFLAGVNLFKEETPMHSKTKRKRRKEEAHAEAKSGGSGNAPLRAA